MIYSLGINGQGSGLPTGSAAHSPAPPSYPTFVLPVAVPVAFAASAAPRGVVTAQILDMLGRGPDRVQALIETLIKHGNANALDDAIKAESGVLESFMLPILAKTRAEGCFFSALRLRPDLIDRDLVLSLCSNRSLPRFLDAVLHLRPDLRDTVGPAGESLSELITTAHHETAFTRRMLDVVAHRATTAAERGRSPRG